MEKKFVIVILLINFLYFKSKQNVICEKSHTQLWVKDKTKIKSFWKNLCFEILWKAEPEKSSRRDRFWWGKLKNFHSYHRQLLTHKFRIASINKSIVNSPTSISIFTFFHRIHLISMEVQISPQAKKKKKTTMKELVWCGWAFDSIFINCAAWILPKKGSRISPKKLLSNLKSFKGRLLRGKNL